MIPTLKIDLGSCVRIYSKNAQCSLCADICPKGAIRFDEQIPKVQEECIDCGGCLGICPTEAISLPKFDTLETLFSFFENRESLISCRKNIPCLAALSVEHLISIALLGEDPVLDLGHCDTCELKEPLFAHIKKSIHEANLYLQKMGSDKSLRTEEVAYEAPNEEQTPDRRAFLRRLSLKGAIKSKVEFEQMVEETEDREITAEDTANIRNKSLPNKRKLFYMALKRIGEPDRFETFAADELSFVSKKAIDDHCDNCSICYRVCPTGALQSDAKGTTILFDTLSCVKCRLCHDVCEPDAISLTPISTQSFFEPKIAKLKTFTRVRCDECANYFTYFGGEKLCPRCKIEEEEAKSLWGIQ